MTPTLSDAALKTRDESCKNQYPDDAFAQSCYEQDYKEGFDHGYIFAKEESYLEIENLKMVCRRLSMAKTIEKRNEIRDKCRHLFEGSVLREEGSGGMSGEQLAAIELEHRLANAEKEISRVREENERLQAEQDGLWIRRWEESQNKVYDLQSKLDKAKSALNRIAMLGSSGMAYTSDFTEKVNTISRGTLRELGE